jgi:predicted NBD/HSP70 family sugar kinase
LPNLANGFGIFLMRQFIMGVPDELLEAARIEGTSEWRILWSIVTPLYLPFLDGKDLAADLSERLGADVIVSNDAQLALLGEIWCGAAQNRQSAVLISVGTGVGGAIMMGGKIIRGIHGSAGAFGWLNLDWREPSDPNHGYVERHASGSALEAIGRQLDPPLTSYEIITCASSHDGYTGAHFRARAHNYRNRCA